MTVLIIYLFIVFIALGVVIYLLATDKGSAIEHTVTPHQIPEQKAQIIEGYHPQEDWTIGTIRQEFDDVKNQIHDFDEVQEQPSQGESLTGFFSYVGYSLTLMFKEKEIFTFALLQWAAIGAGYYLWVQMIGWIPQEVWESAEHSHGGSIADIVLLLWSFVCVGIVAYPLSIFSACMGAAHFINRQGQKASIASCLQMVLPKVWPLWVFTWIDSWITVNQILQRLPKKNDHTTPAQRALSEALYYAWKIGTIGILPGLITGRGLVESCRESMEVVKHKFPEVAKLRLGYSALCWVVGVSAYVGMIFFYAYCPHLMPREQHAGQAAHIFEFYFWAGVPILIATSVIQLFLRPIYVISACHIYSDYLNENKETILLPPSPSKGISALVAFGVLLFLLAMVFLYRDQLGITRMLATKYQ